MNYVKLLHQSSLIRYPFTSLCARDKKMLQEIYTHFVYQHLEVVSLVTKKQYLSNKHPAIN